MEIPNPRASCNLFSESNTECVDFVNECGQLRGCWLHGRMWGANMWFDLFCPPSAEVIMNIRFHKDGVFDYLQIT